MDAGTKVEIMEQGKWVGPFTVTGYAGRTPDHLVLAGPSGQFEIYNDAPYNVRPIPAQEVKAAPAEEFGQWEAVKYESNSSGRNYLVTRKLESAPRVIRIHRAATGAPIWYTLDGANRKAAALNADNSK